MTDFIIYSVGLFVVLFIVGEIVKVILKKSVNVRHYLIYKDINFFHGEYIRPAIKCVPKLLQLGLLKEEDLYIDLTGGDDTMGVSDYYLFQLRMCQNCRKMSNKDKMCLGDKMVNFQPIQRDMSGRLVYYKHSFKINPKRGWTNHRGYLAEKYGIFKEGYMYTDKGSGNRVSKEWRNKLEILLRAYDKYKLDRENRRMNEINAKFKELER